MAYSPPPTPGSLALGLRRNTQGAIVSCYAEGDGNRVDHDL